jgi:hypothetical protein
LQWVNIPIQCQGLNQQILTAPLDIDPDIFMVQKFKVELVKNKKIPSSKN